MAEVYGADTTCLIGLMPNLTTDPSTWYAMEHMGITITPTRQRKQRAKIGAARFNQLDPIKPRPGFLKLALGVKLDGDTRQLPTWLRATIGAPDTEAGPASGIYTHTWNTGHAAQTYAALQLIGVGTNVRIVRGVTLSSLAMAFTGENTQDFDIDLSLRALSRARGSQLSGTVTATPTEAPLSRAIFQVNSVAAAQTISGSWTWDRKIQEDAFLSTTANLSALRPGNETDVKGSTVIRDAGEAYDTMEENDTAFAALHQFLGVITGHEIDFNMPNALFEGIPVDVPTPDLIQRTANYMPFQTSSAPAGQLIVKNDVASYASI